MPRISFAPTWSKWHVARVALVIAFGCAQLLDFATAQGLSSIEPKGYFAEGNPLLAQVGDPVVRQYLGFAIKAVLVTVVVSVAMLQRRRVVGAAILGVGIIAGLFGAWSNLNPWWLSNLQPWWLS